MSNVDWWWGRIDGGGVGGLIWAHKMLSRPKARWSTFAKLSYLKLKTATFTQFRKFCNLKFGLFSIIHDLSTAQFYDRYGQKNTATVSEKKPIMYCSWLTLVYSILSPLIMTVNFHFWPSALDVNPFKVYFESPFRLNESIKS